MSSANVETAKSPLRKITIRAEEIEIGDELVKIRAQRYLQGVCVVEYRRIGDQHVYIKDSRGLSHTLQAELMVQVARKGPYAEDGLDLKEYPCLQLNVPHWYTQTDFRDWLQDSIERKRVATWHSSNSLSGFNEYSDLFVTYNGDREGSNSDMPEQYWGQICAICEQRSIKFAIIWLTNLS